MKLQWLLIFALTGGLFANELVTETKLLGPGDKARFFPKQGESISVQKDLGHLVPGANYDIVMRNGNMVYFDNRNEREDIYIIFNEPLAKGDVIFLKVNQGYFSYTTQQIKALPKTVKKILRASAVHKPAKKRLVNKNGEVLISTEEFCFDDQGEIVECTSPRALVNQKATAKQEAKPLTNPQPAAAVSQPPAPKQSNPENKEANIFSSFAQKLKSALAKIKASLAEKQASDNQPKEAVQKIAEKKQVTKSETAQTGQHATQKPTKEPVQKKSPKPTPDAINQYAGEDTTAAKIARSMQIPTFHAIPAKETDMHFSHTSIAQESRIQPPQISAHTPAPPAGEINNPQNDIIKTPDIQTQADMPTLQSPSVAVMPPKQLTATGLVNETPIAASVTIPPAPQVDMTPIPRRGIPAPQPKIREQTNLSAKPSERQPARISPAQATAVTHPAAPQSVASKDTAQHAAPVTAATTIAQTQQIMPAPATSQPVTPIQENIGKETAPAPSLQEPKPKTSESAQEESTADKIVITKIINKAQPAQTAGEELIPMRDRVLGGGYSDQQNSGKLAVSAYANRKPVSAWVEVYKGKRRVKTFYSGAKKSVTLPEGTYILKATYRMGTSKQKKNLGKVRLKSGESIRKKVYFSIGTLNIVAKKRGKPLYVKVEIYKKGSRSRYAYTFSSRSNGIAHLQLGQGRYKIVVIDHGNKKVLDNVYVKGNQVKTLTVEF